MLWQNTDANVPRRNADDQGENARSLTASDTKNPIAQPGPVCQIEFQLIQLINLDSVTGMLQFSIDEHIDRGTLFMRTFDGVCKPAQKLF